MKKNRDDYMELIKKDDLTTFLKENELMLQNEEKWAKKSSQKLDMIMADIRNKNYQVNDKKREAIVTIFNKCYNFLGVISTLAIPENKRQTLLQFCESFFSRFPELVSHVEFGKRANRARREYEKYMTEVRRLGDNGELSIKDKVDKLKHSDLLQKYLKSETEAKKQLHLLQRQDALVTDFIMKYDFYDFIDLVEIEFMDKLSDLIVKLDLPREAVAELKSCYQRYDQASREQIQEMSKYQEAYNKYLNKYGLTIKNRRPIQEFGSTLKLYNPNMPIDVDILENQLRVEDISKLKMPPGFSYDLLNQSIVGPYINEYVPVKVKSMQKPQSQIPGFRYITPEELLPDEPDGSLTVAAEPKFSTHDYLIDDINENKALLGQRRVVSQEKGKGKLFSRLNKIVKGIYNLFMGPDLSEFDVPARSMTSLTSWFTNKSKILGRNLSEAEKQELGAQLKEVDDLYQNMKKQFQGEGIPIPFDPEPEQPEVGTFNLDDILAEFRDEPEADQPSKGGR